MLHPILKNNLAKWLLFGLVFKLILFWLFVNAMHSYWPKEDVVKSICFVGNDSKSYYEPIERLINGEGYSYEKSSSTSATGREIAPMGYRLPGLLPIYGPLYYLFGGDWAKFLVIIFQFIAEIISVYLLAKTASLLFKNLNVFRISVILYLLNTVVSVYTAYAYSESLCISFFIFSLYFLLRYGQIQQSFDLFYAGLFLCWSMFFRPVIVIFLPFYILVLIYYFVNHNTVNLRYIFRSLILFFAMYILTESIWISRNYIAFKRFIPLYSGLDSYNSKQEMALFKLIIAWGGDIQDWNPSEGRWFVVPSNSLTRVYDETFQKTNPFRESIFTPDYNYDSLKVLRNEYWKALGYNSHLDSINEDLAMAKFSLRIERYYNSFKKYHPFDFFVVSKLRHLKTFIFIQRPYAFPFIKKSIFHKALRVGSVLYYYFILIFGFLGMLLCLRNKNNKIPWILSASALTFLFIHAYMGLTEFRYSLPAYPLFTIFAAYCFYTPVHKLRIKSVAYSKEEISV